MQHFDYFSLLNEGQAKTLVLAANFPPVLIPTEIFDEQLKKEYLSIYVDLDELSNIYTGKIADYTAVFSLKKQDLFLVERSHSEYTVSHFLLYLYEKLHNKYELNNNVLAMAINKTTADFWLEMDGKLMILNRFSFTSKEDFLYMTLNVLSQYNILDYNDIQIFVEDRAENTPSIDLLKQYVSKVQVIG
ncbi:MAG: DUF3822 family protein [Bacteroidales bacterium]|nr:DUF3822 family protein [Bacteroidales bacterium]